MAQLNRVFSAMCMIVSGCIFAVFFLGAPYLLYLSSAVLGWRVFRRLLVHNTKAVDEQANVSEVFRLQNFNHSLPVLWEWLWICVGFFGLVYWFTKGAPSF